jgi:glycerate kinase
MTFEIVIAPGAFKHSLTAAEAAQAIAAGLRRSGLVCALHLLPISDGGNSLLDVLLVNGGERRELTVNDPLMRPVRAAYGLLPDGRTAVVEMALASGLELLKPDELNPLATTTYGTGELLTAALDAGARRFIIGLGGSATVDGGAGCLQALGARLLDADDRELPPGGAALARLARIDVSGLHPRWREVEVIIASDVDNPALGERGAAAVFGPQKGATPSDVATLDASLRHFFTVVRDQLGLDVHEVPGGGAAGAFGAGLMAFLGGRIQSGIEFVLETNGFDDLLATADLVVTGEGRMDEQTIHGKGPVGVARRAAARGVPTVALVGGLDADDALLHGAGLWAVLPVVTGPMPLEQALADAAALVERAALRLGYILQIEKKLETRN